MEEEVDVTSTTSHRGEVEFFHLTSTTLHRNSITLHRVKVEYLSFISYGGGVSTSPRPLYIKFDVMSSSLGRDLLAMDSE
jgi:hypothetical protein